jgi:hypothetical protein
VVEAGGPEVVGLVEAGAVVVPCCGVEAVVFPPGNGRADPFVPGQLLWNISTAASSEGSSS